MSVREIVVFLFNVIYRYFLSWSILFLVNRIYFHLLEYIRTFDFYLFRCIRIHFPFSLLLRRSWYAGCKGLISILDLYLSTFISPIEMTKHIFLDSLIELHNGQLANRDEILYIVAHFVYLKKSYVEASGVKTRCSH
jgi:hypothetical protein